VNRRDVLKAAATATLLTLLRSSAPCSAAAAAFDVSEKSISELQAAMTTGQAQGEGSPIVEAAHEQA
jgi:hypothetical protein